MTGTIATSSYGLSSSRIGSAEWASGSTRTTCLRAFSRRAASLCTDNNFHGHTNKMNLNKDMASSMYKCLAPSITLCTYTTLSTQQIIQAPWRSTRDTWGGAVWRAMRFVQRTLNAVFKSENSSNTLAVAALCSSLAPSPRPAFHSQS